jgi:uncharacterized protein (TIGR03083 family)
MTEVEDVLAQECERVSSVLQGLSEEQYRRPTRCEPWTVKDLVAHLWRALFRIPTALDGDEPSEADTDSVTYWRSYDPADDSEVIAQHARETAADYESGSALARSFDDLWRSCLARTRAEDPDRIIRVWWGPTIRLDEFLKTRVLETVVHGVDLADALAMQPVFGRPGGEMVSSILRGLVGSDLPAALNWSTVELIDKGCGRSELSATDKAILGPLAERFPLLG